MGITEAARASAAHLGQLGTISAIDAYWNTSEAERIDIAMLPQCPRLGANTVSTVSLCDHEIHPDAPDFRLQIIAAYPATLTTFPGVFATSARRAAFEGWEVRRGAVHPHLVMQGGLSRTLEHFLFVRPFLWSDRLPPFEADGRMIAWLMAIPISEPERIYAERHGAEALEQLLDDHHVDVLDFDRDSVTPRTFAP